MPKSTATCNSIVNLMYRATAWANVADNAAASPLANTYVSLHTASPGTGDDQTTNETAYTNYARVAVASSLANWAGTQAAASTTASSGTGGTTSNNGAITFPAPTANWGSVTHMAVYDASSAGNLLWYSALTTAKTVNNGDPAPSFPAASLTLQLDS
jgi:hypothetical protein